MKVDKIEALAKTLAPVISLGSMAVLGVDITTIVGLIKDFSLDGALPYIKNKWLTAGDKVVNHHIQKALIASIHQALDDIQKEYFGKPISGREHKSLEAFFASLKNRSNDHYLSDVQQAFEKEEVFDLVSGSVSDIDRTLTQNLAIDLSPFSDDFYLTVDFIALFKDRFGPLVKFYFREELKKGTEAKQALDLLFYETFQAGIRDSNVTQQTILAQLGNLQKAVIDNTQDPLFRDAWLQAVGRIEDRLINLEKNTETILDIVLPMSANVQRIHAKLGLQATNTPYGTFTESDQDFRLLVDEYVQLLQTRYARERILYIDSQGNPDVKKVSVRELYYEIKLKGYEKDFSTSSESQNKSVKKPETILDFLMQVSSHLLVLGNAGSGKSLLCKWLVDFVTAQYGKTAIAGSLPEVDTLFFSQTVPILLSCKNIQEDDLALSPFDFLKQSLTRLGVGERRAEQLLDGMFQFGYRFLLIIDGLDELASSKVRYEFGEYVENLLDVLKNVSIVLTCRSFNYKDVRYKIPTNFTELIIQDFTRDSKLEFVEKICSVMGVPENDIQDLTTRLLDAKEHAFLINPLSLSNICLFYSRHKVLPERPSVLYEMTLNLLFSRKELTTEYPIKFDANLKYELCYLAYRLCELNVTRFTEKMFAESIHNLRRRELALRYSIDPLPLLDALQNVVGLVQEVDKQRENGEWITYYGFVHKSYQEFLAGLYMNIQANYKNGMPLTEFITILCLEKQLNTVQESRQTITYYTILDRWMDPVNFAITLLDHEVACNLLEELLTRATPAGTEEMDLSTVLLANYCLKDLVSDSSRVQSVVKLAFRQLLASQYAGSHLPSEVVASVIERLRQTGWSTFLAATLKENYRATFQRDKWTNFLLEQYVTVYTGSFAYYLSSFQTTLPKNIKEEDKSYKFDYALTAAMLGYCWYNYPTAEEETKPELDRTLVDNLLYLLEFEDEMISHCASLALNWLVGAAYFFKLTEAEKERLINFLERDIYFATLENVIEVYKGKRFKSPYSEFNANEWDQMLDSERPNTVIYAHQFDSSPYSALCEKLIPKLDDDQYYVTLNSAGYLAEFSYPTKKAISWLASSLDAYKHSFTYRCIVPYLSIYGDESIAAYLVRYFKEPSEDWVKFLALLIIYSTASTAMRKEFITQMTDLYSHTGSSDDKASLQIIIQSVKDQLNIVSFTGLKKQILGDWQPIHFLGGKDREGRDCYFFVMAPTAEVDALLADVNENGLDLSDMKIVAQGFGVKPSLHVSRLLEKYYSFDPELLLEKQMFYSAKRG